MPALLLLLVLALLLLLVSNIAREIYLKPIMVLLVINV